MPDEIDPGNERSVSYWIDTTPRTDYPDVTRDENADVVIVGGGIVGVTAAYLLAKAGKSVVCVDRERIGLAETGHTTAHLQIVIDTRLKDLVKRFGVEGAKLGWDSQREAVETIEQIARDERIGCELERLDAYLYSPHKKDKAMLRREVALARKIGYEAHMADAEHVPYDAACAIRYPDQGKFHPRKYLLGVAKAAERLGARFFEGPEAVEVEEGEKVKVKLASGNVLAGDWLVTATNTPFQVGITLHTRMSAYRTYAAGFLVPRGLFGDCLYWDTLDPYHYTRVERQGERDLVILGGEDHAQADHKDTQRAFDALAEYMEQATDDFDIAYRWSGEILETADDYPYIGRAPGRRENELIVTGDSGTGMTNGTIGAVMIAERILGRGTPWDELYAPERQTTGLPAAKGLMLVGLADAKDLAKNLTKGSEIASLSELAPGDGAIVRYGMGKHAAVSRRADGSLCAVDAACTHAGCMVGWNTLEQSWDCPCHGGRFAADGRVLHGPPVKGLKPVPLDELALDDAPRRTESA